MGSIKRLPDAVHSWVRSGIFISDLARVVEELVFNSLDAGSTKVSVTVGVGTCYVKVVDNGSGITRDGLVLLGERYATSKFDQLTDMNTVSGTFGFKGEALSSISDISLLEIISKAHGRPNGYHKVMKGFKCLYLGIDNARQDVGTTVIVRDVFYNQPVRRKQIQSSPKKALHSVKECVLRIAFMQPKVAFQVLDAESEDELLCTYPSSSPLPLLMSTYGIEILSSLQELNASDGLLKLSGYISGTSNSSAVKAFQYVYINSQFICKSPIHKLINQLATRLYCSETCMSNSISQNGKRNTFQAQPSYILNMICPRILYDLAFESSKTSVEFKDWVPIHTFIEKIIRDFWNLNTSYDFLENHEIERKRRRIEKDQASLDLSAPLPKIITEGYKDMPDRRESSNSGLNSHKNASKLEEHQSDAEFCCQTDDLFQSYGESVIRFRETVDEVGSCHLWMPDISHTEYGEMENNCFASERFKHVDHVSSPRSGVLVNKRGELTGSPVPPDFLILHSGIEEVGNNIEEPFLQSCSFRRYAMESFATNEEFKFLNSGFGMKGMQLNHDDGANIGEVDDNDQNFEPRTLRHDEDASVGSSSRFWINSDFNRSSEHLLTDSVKPISIDKECYAEENNFPLDSDAQFGKIASSHQPFTYDWSSATSDSLLVPSDIEHITDGNVFESCTKYDKSAMVDYFSERKGDRCNWGCDIIKESAGCEHCLLSNSRNISSELKCSAGYHEDYYKFHHGNNLSDVFLPKFSDAFTDKTDWLCLNSYHKDGHNEERTWRGQPIHQEAYFCEKRSRRSHSAPPFHRVKKKYLGLNPCETVRAGKPHAHVICDVSKMKENSKLKQTEQLFGMCHPHCRPSPGEGALVDIRPEVNVAPCEIDTPNGKTRRGDQCWYIFNIDSFEDPKSSDIQDEFDSCLKWRSSPSQFVNGGKSHKLNNQETILDISSGILYLAGDSLVPESISRDCLEDAEVLQQVDKKFIPVVAGGILAVIDQHAADERIRLEELRHKVLSGELKTITYLDAEQELVLPEVGYQFLQNYADQIQNWGWICNIHAQDSKSFRKNLKTLHKQPASVTLIAVPCILGVQLSDIDLLEFLQQLADTDGSSTIPPSVLRVLNSKACRGAIMFGDTLLPSECSLIVEELKQTSLCFQCAHGRPTTAPLVNLENLHKQIAKLELWSGGSNEWHGLYRHEISLERARRRLSSAVGVPS